MYNATFGEYTVEIVDEPTYSYGSAGNIFQYDLAYRHPEDTGHLSAYGIKVYKGGLFRSAVVMAATLGMVVSQTSAIIDSENLIVICGNKSFNLSLPELQLNWIAGDTFKMHDDYIEVMDWLGYRYRLLYDGKMVDDGMAPPI